MYLYVTPTMLSCDPSHCYGCNLDSTHVVFHTSAAPWVSDQFPLLTPAEMKHWFPETDYEFSCHCFAWCRLSAQRFLPTGSPTSPPVLEHGDFTLLLSKACFSECVSDKHMVFSEERSLKTPKRDGPLYVILKIFCCMTFHT